ncbi:MULTISPECIES: DUF3060 domain-containing protein [unclassified Mycobacterium]|uniref:DUF3060 domain-containing protein n=1 Tax=unclassified Mycobacterium TaxID=2642494 RepID=UPI002740DC75|nr:MULTISPECIES: DUF3060 domain-containing protein [unclassified Mycobacterium]MDP7704326.1 DUF3060 domain-containing protein [Mycobacterium sp. TY815]MDP7722797.1 DUF3060 domain-containing protein [Mycobacterium sp. TY814]
MKPEDDPEARIRELEQPLADQARASESGYGLGSAGGYDYPPPPPGPVPPPMPSNMPPPGYGYSSPYSSGSTPRSSSGMRWFWILAAVGVLGVLVLVGGIAAYAAHQFSHDDLVVPSPTESTSESPGTVPSRTAPSTGKTHAPSAGPSPSATAPAGEEVTISGINENKTVACTGNVINISGISNTVTLTGHCATVNVSGLQNVVTVDNVDTIEAAGLNNKVVYHSGSPKISKSGSGNVVEQG